jgi:excinuclease ABC subunit C
LTVDLALAGEELESIPDRPAVFLLWADGAGPPYLARTTLLRRRLRRLLARAEGLSRVLRLGGIAQRLEYWTVGSQLEAALVHLAIAQQHFPEDWPKITRLKPPTLLRLTSDSAFPRTMISTRLGRGVYVGPFASRTGAESYQADVLDLFQLRRCEENLVPTPQHPGCIYGEMNKCLRPCQAVVSQEEYATESARFEQFLRTRGRSLLDSAETARDQASADMQFEEAQRLHERVDRIRQVATTAGDIARPLDQLAGVAIVRAAKTSVVALWFFAGGQWLDPLSLQLADTVDGGLSLDRRVRELTEQLRPVGLPNLQHMAILLKWHGSSWRDGEWISFDSYRALPYRKIVNAIARVNGAQPPTNSTGSGA